MKILFIAVYSPMINNSASIETLQYLNNLNIENEVQLLTVNFPKNSIYYDENLFKLLDKNIKLHIISGGKIFEKIMPKKNNSNNIKNQGNTSIIKNVLKKGKSIVAIPDMYFNWSKKASNYAIKMMREEKFDVIFSMHEPPSSHLCALRIKEEFKDIPWVTYWSDPWLKDSTRENINFIRRKFESNMEKKVVNLCDKFIFVTDKNKEDYIKTYNIDERKTFTINRGYDESYYNDILNSSKNKVIKNLDNKKINLIYAGEIFSKLRDVNPFIDALKNIEKTNNDLFNKLNILFFGNIDSDSVKENLKTLKNVKVSPRIDYNSALQYILKGDVLIIFGNKNSSQIPAKIYDYLGANGRILVILGDENDPILKVASSIDKCVITKNNNVEIEKSLKYIVNCIENKESYLPLKEYEWKNISKRINSILRG